jgi:hypothetical protein
VSEPAPVPTLASSPQSAAAFDEIRDAWGNAERTDHSALRELIQRFLVRFPKDGLIPLAQVYLAIVTMQQGDLASADAQLGATEHLPPGTAHDLRTVALARRLRIGGDADGALDLLRPLVGKNVDPVTRAVFEEELTLSALATHRDYEAISYMDAWVRASSEDDKVRTVATVSALVEQLPKEVLVGALQAMRAQRANFGYGIDIERILAERLGKMAAESGDAELARLLLDPNAGTIVVGGDAGKVLSELATSSRGLNVVQGRTIGLLLPTESPGLRDETADVLRGVMWALGLPRGLRSHQARASTTPDAGASSTRAECVPLEPAPALEDPRPEEGLRLVTRDDAGSVDRTEVSLDELAGEGAAIVIAGLDAQTAARAIRWGNGHGVPVVALVPPAEHDDSSRFGFVLGESRESVIDALARAAPALSTGPVAPVIDLSEVPIYPPSGGRVGMLTLLPPISCDVPPTRAGEPRFPISDWDHDKTRNWLVSGSRRCAQDIVGELSASRARGVVALTLEAAALPPHTPGLRVISATAGVVPGDILNDPREDEVKRFSETLGNVSWWTALGRDAATLARVAIDPLPSDVATDVRAVADRRVRARDLLASAHARLWTTEQTGWSDAQTMKRTVCAADSSITATSH